MSAKIKPQTYVPQINFQDTSLNKEVAPKTSSRHKDSMEIAVKMYARVQNKELTQK